MYIKISMGFSPFCAVNYGKWSAPVGKSFNLQILIRVEICLQLPLMQMYWYNKDMETLKPYYLS